MRLTKSLKADIEQHARACYPEECCGVIAQNIVDGAISYIRLNNVAHDKKAILKLTRLHTSNLSSHLPLKQSYIATQTAQQNHLRLTAYR